MSTRGSLLGASRRASLDGATPAAVPQPGLPVRRRWRRPAALALVTTAVVAGTLAARGGGEGAPPAPPAPARTATVQLKDLVNRDRVDGTLGYAAMPGSLTAPRAGVLTWVAGEGTVVDRGQPLFALDDQPVLLLVGSSPAHRHLVEGTTGPDVRQLNENLVALGHANENLRDSDRFTAATAAALRRLQATAGAEPTGIVRHGDVVFLPGPVRIAGHKVSAGAAVDTAAEVATMSSADRVVTVQLDAAKQQRVKVGDPVVVELPSGSSTPGTISNVAKVAKKADSGGSDDSDDTTVEVTVSLADPAATGTLDQAPVKVGITTAAAKGVLAVPVGALVALAEGGYGVEVVRDGRHQLVGVETGMFSDSEDMVEVRGDLRVGESVVVAE